MAIDFGFGFKDFSKFAFTYFSCFELGHFGSNRVSKKLTSVDVIVCALLINFELHLIQNTVDFQNFQIKIDSFSLFSLEMHASTLSISSSTAYSIIILVSVKGKHHNE